VIVELADVIGVPRPLVKQHLPDVMSQLPASPLVVTSVTIVDSGPPQVQLMTASANSLSMPANISINHHIQATLRKRLASEHLNVESRAAVKVSGSHTSEVLPNNPHQYTLER
jgi:hypothetical protein